MSILNVEHLTHGFGDRAIFEDVSFRLLKGEHIGLIGANGEGKSTFMSIVTGRLMPDEGKVEWAKNVRAGYLDQHAVLEEGMTIGDVLRSAFSWLFEMETEMNQMFEQMAEATPEEMERLLEETGTYQELLDQHDFYMIDAKVDEVARALGLLDLGLDRDVTDLSGGQRTKVLLAKLLLEKPDILLLDEPTNHMDMRSKDILKNAIMKYDGTVVVVSHDREFLDGMVEKVYEFRDGGVKEYLGGIYYFLEKRKLESLQEIERRDAPAKMPAKGDEPKPAVSGKLSYEQRKEQEKQLRKAKKVVETIEAELADIEKRIAEYDARFAAATEYNEADYKAYNELKTRYDHQMHEWEKASYELEIVAD